MSRKILLVLFTVCLANLVEARGFEVKFSPVNEKILHQAKKWKLEKFDVQDLSYIIKKNVLVVRVNANQYCNLEVCLAYVGVPGNEPSLKLYVADTMFVSDMLDEANEVTLDFVFSGGKSQAFLRYKNDIFEVLKVTQKRGSYE